MKITIHEATCDVGYAAPRFRGLTEEAVLKPIADSCRADWKDGAGSDWGGWWAKQGDKTGRNDPPAIPETDREVVELFFWGNPEFELPWIDWDSFELDIGAPLGEDVRVGPLTLRRSEGGAELHGTLIDDMPGHSEALESLITALTAAGFPVHGPEFAEAVQSAVDACGNNADPDDITYARVAWRAGDVTAVARDMSEEDAEVWLASNAGHIRNQLVERGFGVICDLLAYDGIAVK